MRTKRTASECFVCFFNATVSNRTFSSLPALVLFVLSVVGVVTADDEWPQFRGPDGQGHSDVVGLPLRWSETENVVWKTAIPGEGHSSPVISGNQIWMTSAVVRPLSAEEEKKRLDQLKNKDGLQIGGALTLRAILIDRESGKMQEPVSLLDVPQAEPRHSMNSYASPTPVISGDLVFFHFGTYGTVCVRRSTSEILWKNTEFHIDHQNGPGSSPIVFEDKLIIHFDGTDAQFLAAFDQQTGKVVWKTVRSGEMDKTPELKKAYGTPLLVTVNENPLLISPAANWVYGYNPRDGSEIWKASYGQLGFSTVPRPVIFENTVYIATSYMSSRLLAVRFDGQGDVTSSHIAWKSDRQIPKKPSMMVVGEHLYFVSDGGILRCVNAKSGDEIWFERLPGEYSASPLSAEGRVYFFGQNGTTTVLKDGDSFEELAVNRLDGEFMASPAVAGKSLFLRTTTHLYRIENR